MKRAIIVKGQSNSGKTLVLNDFFNWILSIYTPTILYNHSYPNGDFKALIQYNNLQISFFTQGDYGDEVEKFLADAVAIGSDIIILSCRTRGGTYDAVRRNLAFPQYLIDYVHTHQVQSTGIAAFHALRLQELKTRIIGLPK